MKQINIFEDQLGVKLFDRTNHGLTLTPAGKLIYQDAHFVISHSQQTLARAKALADHQPAIVRVGSSLMRPGREIIKRWQAVGASYLNIKLRVVPFDDGHRSYLWLVTHLGEKVDVVAGIYPSDCFHHRCRVRKLGEQQLCCAVPVTHRLAAKKQLTWQDLNGQHLIMIKRGDTNYLDRLRDEIEAHHPQIQIVDVEKYDVDTMNLAEKNNWLMVTTKLWAAIHPALVTIPVKWDFTVPYGLLYPLHPSAAVADFVAGFRRG